MSEWSASMNHRQRLRLALGLVISAVGLLLGLGSLGWIDFAALLRLWPLVLIVIGVVKLLGPPETGEAGGSGLLLVAVGTGLLFVTLGVVSLWHFWPVLLLLLGVRLVYLALLGAPGRAQPLDAATVDALAFLSGANRIVRAKDFRGGTALAFLGGCNLDLRSCAMTEGDATLELTAVCGGIELRVPVDWAVESRGVAMLGGFEDKTQAPPAPAKRLVVTGVAVLGGVRIGN